MDNNIAQETKQGFLKREGASRKNGNDSPWNILVVDDDYDVLKLTELSLRNCEFNNKSLKLYFAKSAEEAKLYFKSIPNIALILLDVVMESNHAGLHLVKYIRNELENKTVRIILRTGYPGEAPEKEVIHNYEINDYKTKNDLTPDKLYTALITGLRDYKVLLELQNREMELEDARVRAENSDKFK
ncbi:MAG: response regulator, partial [Bacteroidales bacterium]|nr:response regulator [Bacteroidales bacterium]